MNSTNHKIGQVGVILEREQINAVLQALNCISIADTSNIYSVDAEKLKRKIIQHGRTFNQMDTDKVSLFFFENEAASFIRLTAIFLSSVLAIEKDYYPEIGQTHKKGLGNAQSAEQKSSGKPL